MVTTLGVDFNFFLQLFDSFFTTHSRIFHFSLKTKDGFDMPTICLVVGLQHNILLIFMVTNLFIFLVF